MSPSNLPRLLAGLAAAVASACTADDEAPAGGASGTAGTVSGSAGASAVGGAAGAATGGAAGAPSGGSGGAYADDCTAQPGDPPCIYVAFILNVHDWVLPVDSADTVSRVVDVAEQNDVPVDVYLTDPTMQAYVTGAPQLVERLRTSPSVAVAHHVRPPAPYYSGFDFAGLGALDQATLQSVLLDHEQHRIDLVAGEPTAEPGGFRYMADVFAEPPWAVAPGGAGLINPTLVAIWKDMGARFAVRHERTDLGDQLGELYARPEHVEIKLYEHLNETPEEVIAGGVAADACGVGGPGCPSRLFVNVKMHETDFYAQPIPWTYIYYEDEKRTKPKQPPFDLDAWQATFSYRPDSLQQKEWAAWEGAVAWVAQHRAEYRPVSLRQLAALVDGL